MEEEKIKFETAVLAKEKGFDINTYASCWVETLDGEIIHNSERKDIPEHDRSKQYAMQPSQSLLHTWIRETHRIYLLIIPTITASWTFKSIRVISKIDNDVIKGLKSVSDLPPYKDVHGEDYSTFEAALEAGLVAALNEI